MYITRKIKAKHLNVDTEYLDQLAREAGRCYSKTVSLIRKTHKRKGFWLSEGNIQKYQRLRGYQLCARSRDHPSSDTLKPYKQSVKAISKHSRVSARYVNRIPMPNLPNAPPSISRCIGNLAQSLIGMAWCVCLTAKPASLFSSKHHRSPFVLRCSINGVATISHWYTKLNRLPVR